VTEHWLEVPDLFELPHGVVHVWRSSLERSQAERDVLWRFLSADERARAERFHFDIHRHHYIVGRGLLRWLNGRYLSIPPQEIQFAYSKYEKPALVNEPALQFNVSHSHEGLLIGFTWETALGVDIEHVRSMDDMDAIARRFFSPVESAAYLSVADDEKPDTFFNCWTRKESFIKAVGEGLSFPLDEFEVSLLPGEPARLLEVRGSKQEAARWSMQSLDPIPGYRAAFIVESEMPESVFFDGNQVDIELLKA
jgi:4'-phosphopantetheinyl transferase